MLRATAVCFASLASLPAFADDFDLLVGFRAVVAGLIRDEGYRCPDVKSVTTLGIEPDGSIARIVCGPIGQTAAERAFRVVFHPDNEVSVKPIASENPAAGSLCVNMR
jgi:hypothetical protein